jgi:hypothetical protein
MTAMTLEAALGAKVGIDLCASCQAFWFDQHENLQLLPGSTLKLFRLIGDQAASKRAPLSIVLKCPRCGSRLLPTHDLQRNTPFQYWRCDHKHGRLITFFNFLREKNFIRPLSPSQLDELRQNIQMVNCSNCGAPIDLATSSSCTHCGSPVSMLDMKQAERMIAQLQQADRHDRPVDPALALQLERARREVEASLSSWHSDTEWWRHATSTGLVEAGLAAAARWLKKSAG